MSFKELREKSIDELREELLSLRQTQLKLTMQKTSGQLEQTHQIRQARRDVARIKTLLSQHKVKV
ncbi:50S ribosomal protein L29 [Cardiobacterium hominis]|jgi:ribosomal protein L29|uniref:Large ribosomal subunit protein uL29 n=1 Tax=Cardiobacterium hominis (strain ATCC 15826 / DSM 8339 / NCTC 10426 / 6573) TaxID=638300 RepID=C8N6H0_CARH6|nr:50S ribosomal protein L29 [Cardiobacterium hominis]EEV89777.1 ribosomal protein L29 [Cardiobacterium hominis ATCC 15826]